MRAGDDEPTGSGVAGDGGDDGHGERDEVSNRGSEDGAMRLEGETWAQVRSKTFEKGPGLYSDIRKKAKEFLQLLLLMEAERPSYMFYEVEQDIWMVRIQTSLLQLCY
ncbi:uncharacterized protein LOC120269326 isoform X1 [Dioscorea cayenensis subsp. rotundata]|uniref:Uncharacterized protein LOC120269326 isoform X1 n=1 Tax=Dioscorea cayennensis subsp. rotundata TaxID=55577 RepID=A0AB40BYN9_DIOCR|nr:uncharacterized protein LOC120269326 isoform X1 [Dioscorea cayenensis subsp. rotundata]